MAQPLRILFVEDLPSDQEMAERQLRAGGLEFISRVVDSQEPFLQALIDFQPDLIISDYSMPDFNGMQALKLCLDTNRDIPFIILTGSINEETAAECIKAGAFDYVIKEHITRLPFVVQEAIKQRQISIEKVRTEEQLRDSELRYRGLFEDSPISLWEEDFSAVRRRLNGLRAQGVQDFRAYFTDHPEFVVELAGLVKVLDVNKVTLEIFGAATKAEILTGLAALVPEDDLEKIRDEFISIAEGATHFSQEALSKTFDGRIINLNIGWAAVPGFSDDLYKVIISKEDITEQVHHKHELEAISAMSSALRNSSPDQDVIPVIINELAKLVSVDGSAISKLDEETGKSIVVAGSGAWKSWAGTTIPMRNGIFNQIYETSSAIIDANADKRDSSEWPGILGNIHSVACTPLVANGIFIGAIWTGKIGMFSEGHIRILKSISDLAASSIRNSELYQQAKDRASTLASLYDAGLAINSTMEPQSQIEFLSSIILEEFNADRLVFLKYLPGEFCYTAELCFGFRKELQTEIYQTRYPAKELDFPLDTVRVNELPINLSNDSGSTGLSLGDSSIRSVLYVPVNHGRNLRAILGVMSTKSNAFSINQERLLVQFANQAAIALENGSLLTETRLQVQRLKSLRKIDEAINGSLDLNLTTSILLEQIMDQLKVDAADILLFSSVTKSLNYVNGHGFTTPALKHTELRLGQGLAGRAALERQVVHISGLNLNDEFFTSSPYMKEEGFVEYFGVPLISKGRLKGLLEIFNRSPLTPDNSWIDFMRTLVEQAAIAIDNLAMFNDLQSSNNELTLAYDATIEGWSNAMDLRDKETEGHTRRVTEITVRLAKAMGIRPEELIHIQRGALLHDIGKMGIPDSILLKPGSLTEEEWVVMRKHPDYAFDLLSPIAFLKPALDIPYCHHEKWDGSGYPRKLNGEQIPVSARLFAVVDVWDALTSDRPYRAAWPASQAVEYIREQAGKHFDPQAVEVFLNSYLSQESPFVKPTILIVDDEESVTRSLARSLKDQFTILTANSGEDALKIIERFEPAVVLTDQRMPGISGTDLMEQIHKLRPKSLGIIISAYTDVGALTAAINLPNVRGFIPKPIDMEVLQRKLEETIAQYREMAGV